MTRALHILRRALLSDLGALAFMAAVIAATVML